MAPSLIYFVAIAEFDIKKGPTLQQTYPKSVSLGNYTEDDIGQISMPEQAHLHKTDISHMILHIGKETLYGVAFFGTKEGKEFSRGARQNAFVVVSRKPYFDAFEPFMADALQKLLDGHLQKNDLKQIHDVLNDIEHKNTLNLWDKTYQLTMTRDFKEDEFGGANLTKLIKLFKTDTLLLWYSMLRQDRILFSGQKAVTVGSCCLAAPLLVAPLKGFTDIIFPHVPLAHMEKYINQPKYIMGCTNPMFETKTQFLDVLVTCEPSFCIIHQHGIRISGKDKQFIKNVINGINANKGEKWVRDQFRKYTEQFLESFLADKLVDSQKRFISDGFGLTKMFQGYLSQRDSNQKQETDSNLSPIALFEKLKHASEDNTPDREIPLILKSLSESLEDISHIEQIIEMNGIPVLEPFLSSDKANEKKYAVMTLASMAITIKGQIAILSEDLLPCILNLVVSSKYPNVRSAACGCLQKIATLFIGAKALIDIGAVKPLLDIVCSSDESDLILKTNAANTLLFICRLFPEHLVEQPQHSLLISQLSNVSDINYTSIIIQLLDVTSTANFVEHIQVSSTIRDLVAQLPATIEIGEGQQQQRVPNFPLRTSATTALQAELLRSPAVALQLVRLNALPQLWSNQQLKQGKDNQLSWLTWIVISSVADTNAGADQILEKGIISRTLSEGLDATSLNYLFQILRFFEIVCQQKKLGLEFIACGGVQKLVVFCCKHYGKDYRLLCTPALSALRYLVRFQPHHYQKIREDIAPLRGLLSYPLPGNDDFRGKELHALLCTVLYMTRILNDQLPENQLFTQFYQTIGRRRKVLSGTLRGSSYSVLES